MDRLVSGENPFELVRKFMLKNKYSLDGTNSHIAEAFYDIANWDMQSFKEGVNVEDDIKTIHNLCNVIWALSGYAYSRGFNIIGAYDEIASCKIKNTAPDLMKYVRRPCDEPKPEHLVMGLGEE